MRSFASLRTTEKSGLEARGALAIGDRRLGLGARQRARRTRHADGRDLAVLGEAAVVPLAAQHDVADAHGALAVRHVVGVAALEAHRVVPAIAARALALAVAIGADEAVDGMAVLEP